MAMPHASSYQNPGYGLPDPEYDAAFYADIPVKRLIAWGIDVVVISMLVGLLTMMGLFLPLFFLPFLFLVVSFLYRWASLRSWSATLGMRLVAIELRDADGARLGTSTAFLHTAGYVFSVMTFPLQLISIAMMLTTARRQGLSDMILGTAAINRRAG